MSILELENASDIRHHAEEEEEESPGGEKLAFAQLSPHTSPHPFSDTSER